MSEQNFIELTGEVVYPEYIETQNGYPKFSGKIAVVKNGVDKQGVEYSSKDYFRFVSWGELAKTMSDNLVSGINVKLNGRLSSRTYTSTCKNCGNPDKRYWYEVTVDNFIIL